MAELFGFEFRKKVKEQELPSFTPPSNSDDGAVVVSAGGAFGTYVDLDGTVRSEAELVTKYREMSLQPECDAAIDEIINESISIDEEHVVNINLDDLKVNDNIKSVITEEFNYCLNMLEFNKFAYEIYRRWYIDGRLYYHVVIDDKDPSAGIKELRYVDPRKIRKIREVQKKRIQANNPGDAVVTKTVNEYFIFNEKGFNFGNKSVGPSTTGLKIAKDSVLHIVSGLTDNQGTMVLSYLHKAIKPLNQLRTLEDALVIYRLARAPERRIWYIDVGNLPKMKAEQYVRDIMVKHKNRLIYDAQTGDIRDDRKFMTMLEDYWLPRREGGRGTEVTTLPGGQTLGQMDDVLYFQKKFLQALNVPVSRLNSDALFSIGRATEITRDELKFEKFVVRLRNRFSQLFLKLLEKQLVLKGVTTLEDWKFMSPNIRFDFSSDNYFGELKDAEMLNGRIQLASSMQPLAGEYYSHNWIRKNVLKQTDTDIKEQDVKIAKEQNSGEPRWINPTILSNEQMAIQTDMMQQQSQQGLQPGVEGQMGGPDPETQQKMEQVRQAEMIVDQMKKMPKANRTMADEAKYKAAVQVIAKNPELTSKAQAGGAPQSQQ
jgi:Bacteriophage T4-like portal protein (Gp20)